LPGIATLPMGFAVMRINGPNTKIMLAIVPTRCWDGVLFTLLFGQAKSSKEGTLPEAGICINRLMP